MNLYISAGSTELERARAFMARCREAGHEITHDWTQDVERHQRGEDVSAAQAAHSDFGGVAAAEALVALVPAMPSKGLWYELGVADALHVFTCIVGPEGCADIWSTRAMRFAPDEDAAMDWLAWISSPDVAEEAAEFAP